MEERLQKILARAGLTSRRGAEELIRQGKVTVDGRVVTEMGVKVDPARQRLVCDGKPVEMAEAKVYILLNKPRGYVTTLDDPQGRPIVTALLKGVGERVFPVGRLDLDTEGALLLTNDGELAHRLLHPSFEITRTYEAVVRGRPEKRNLARLAGGIMLEGRRTSPAAIKVLAAGAGETTVRIIIHEGRKRQVRKMFEAIGHRVLHLKRTAYGDLTLRGLGTGEFRILTTRDLELIFKSKNSLYNKVDTRYI